MTQATGLGTEGRTPSGLTNNQLKIIAMLAMLIDHVGMIIFPGIMALRYIGRIALPIFAYMIAEGCHYTRDRKSTFCPYFRLV